MTTIAYRNRWLVSDSQVTADNSTVDGEVQKIFKIKGSYYGFAGDLQATQLIKEWLKDGGDKPDIPERVDIIKIHNGKSYVSTDSNLIFYRIKAPYMAIGSGFQIALGAMEVGATAKEAVKISKKLSTFTGGKIKSIYCS